MSAIAGIHPVREALLSGRGLDRVMVARGAGGPRLQEIIDLCRERGVALRFESRRVLDKAAGAASHQGVVAVGAARPHAKLSELTDETRMVVVLDGLEDPHNLGAVIRTANAAGADAVMIPERRAVGLTEVVERVAAGALAYVPVIRVNNISRAVDQLKDTGFWIYGLDERGDQSYDEVDYADRAALILGSEGRGMHQHLRKRCDALVRIPMAGRIASLNVSVSAGIALFEWKRRQALKK